MAKNTCVFHRSLRAPFLLPLCLGVAVSTVVPVTVAMMVLVMTVHFSSEPCARPRCQLISDTYLKLYIAQLQAEGYSVFVVQGALPVPMRDSSFGSAKCWHSLSDILTAPPPQPKAGKNKRKAEVCWSQLWVRTWRHGVGRGSTCRRVTVICTG